MTQRFVGVDLARDGNYGCRVAGFVAPDGALVIERILWDVPCAGRANSGTDTTDNDQHRPDLNE